MLMTLTAFRLPSSTSKPYAYLTSSTADTSPYRYHLAPSIPLPYKAEQGLHLRYPYSLSTALDPSFQPHFLSTYVIYRPWSRARNSRITGRANRSRGRRWFRHRHRQNCDFRYCNSGCIRRQTSCALQLRQEASHFQGCFSDQKLSSEGWHTNSASQGEWR